MNKFVQIAVEEIGSQLALAKHCGVNQSAISLWLKGGGISGRYLPLVVSAGNGRFTYEEICQELAELAKNHNRS